MKITSVVVALALTGGAVAAQPWIPADCQTRYESRWGEFARAMRAAKPDSQIYAPHPYPLRDAEVIGDFKFGYQRMLKGLTPGEIAKEEWPLASALENNTLAFRVLRVENWAPDRCRPDQQRDYSYLLYLTDTVTGEEIGRAFVNQAGLLSGWTLAPAADEPQAARYRASVAPSLGAALAEAATRYGIRGSRAQYVVPWGTPACPIPSPCVAFRAGAQAYLLRAGELVEVTAPRKVFAKAEIEATRARFTEIAASVDPAAEWLVSIADSRWILAPKVRARQ